MTESATGIRTLGKRFDYFTTITVTNSSYGADASVAIPIRGVQSLSLILYGSDPIYYSFNGTHDSGEMRASTPSNNLLFINRPVSKIWFKLKSGTTSEVRIEAWRGA